MRLIESGVVLLMGDLLQPWLYDQAAPVTDIRDMTCLWVTTRTFYEYHQRDIGVADSIRRMTKEQAGRS